MDRDIKLTGTNKKLLQQYIFIMYRANKAADRNRWKQFNKHNEKAQAKLQRITYNLGINTNKYNLRVTPDGLFLTEKEGRN
ncbi:hypothetical protein [Rhodopseudomonas parapalustris]